MPRDGLKHSRLSRYHSKFSLFLRLVKLAFSPTGRARSPSCQFRHTRECYERGMAMPKERLRSLLVRNTKIPANVMVFLPNG